MKNETKSDEIIWEKNSFSKQGYNVNSFFTYEFSASLKSRPFAFLKIEYTRFG